jgi:hypothetical protein
MRYTQPRCARVIIAIPMSTAAILRGNVTDVALLRTLNIGKYHNLPDSMAPVFLPVHA